MDTRNTVTKIKMIPHNVKFIWSPLYITDWYSSYDYKSFFIALNLISMANKTQIQKIIVQNGFHSRVLMSPPPALERWPSTELRVMKAETKGLSL